MDLPFVACVLALQLSAAPQADPGVPRPGENPLARAALGAFAAKCVQCHGPQVAHPRAAFGYVTDLKRLVTNGKYIVPGDLVKSELWSEIAEGDMPPDEARNGPLDPAQVQAVREWILAGAPVLDQDVPFPETPALAPTAMAADPLAPPRPPAVHPERPTPRSTPLLTLIGRLHVVVVHFPIALIITAAFTEAVRTLRGIGAPSPSARLCLIVGAPASVVTAALGWVHAGERFPGPMGNPFSIAGIHRWIGIAAACVACAAMVLMEHDARRRRGAVAPRFVLALAALLVAIAGHFGGLLTHGADFLTP